MVERSLVVATAAFVAALSADHVAMAQWPAPYAGGTREQPELPEDAFPHERRFGAGTAFGGGYAVGLPQAAYPFSYQNLEFGYATPVLVLPPTLELSWFNHRQQALELSVPTNFMWFWLLRSPFFGFDVFYTVNVGHGAARLVAGAGTGNTFDTKAASFRFPLELGLELLTKGEAFGFRLLARPYAELRFNNQEPEGGGGAVFLIGLNGYKRGRARVRCP